MADRELQIRVTVEADQAQRNLDQLNAKLQNNEGIASKVAEAEKRLDAAFKEVDKSADKAVASTARLNQAHNEADKVIGGLTQKLVQYAGPVALLAAAKSAWELGSQIQDMSQKVGMSAQKFDELTLMSREFGIESNSVIQAMLTLQDRIAGGDKSAVAALQKLNINLEQFKNSSPDQMFYTLADSVRELGSQQERIATLSDLGGRSFRQFAGMMSEDLNRLKGEMPAMADATAKELDTIAESWDRAWAAAKRYAGAALAATNAGVRATQNAIGVGELPPGVAPKPLTPKLEGRPNENTDLLLGLDKGFTDRLSARPPEFGGGLPGYLPGASASTPGDEFSTQLTGRMPNLAQPQAAPFDAAAAWFSNIEEAAAPIPAAIDKITTSTREAAGAFKEMGIMAGIALSVPMGVSMNDAYKEAGVGSGLGGTIATADSASAAMSLGNRQRFAKENAGTAFLRGGGGANVTVNANGSFFNNDAMIKKLADQVGQAVTAAYGNAKRW